MKGPTNLLAIDTSTNRIAVALLQFGKPPVVAIKEDGLGHAEFAAVLINQVVKDSGLMLQELGGIVCGIARQVAWGHAQQAVVLDQVVGHLLAIQGGLVASQIHAVFIDDVAIFINTKLAVA